MTATTMPSPRYLLTFPPPNAGDIDDPQPWAIGAFPAMLITSGETFQLLSENWGGDFELDISEAAYERDLVQHRVRHFGGYLGDDLRYHLFILGVEPDNYLQFLYQVTNYGRVYPGNWNVGRHLGYTSIVLAGSSEFVSLNNGECFIGRD